MIPSSGSNVNPRKAALVCVRWTSCPAPQRRELCGAGGGQPCLWAAVGSSVPQAPEELALGMRLPVLSKQHDLLCQWVQRDVRRLCRSPSPSSADPQGHRGPSSSDLNRINRSCQGRLSRRESEAVAPPASRAAAPEPLSLGPACPALAGRHLPCPPGCRPSLCRVLRCLRLSPTFSVRKATRLRFLGLLVLETE